MLTRLIVISGALVGFARIGLPQENPRGVASANVIAARQASLDMSSITFRSMVKAMEAGTDPKSLGYPAAALAKWAKALPGMFPSGTGQGETSVFSQALPAIWRDRAGFEQAAANYADATRRLVALAQEADKEGFTKQLEEVNQACASCHSRYKAGDQTAPKK